MLSIFKSLLVTALVFAVSVSKVQAVNIAILDTGLDSGILGPFIEPGGFDFVNNDNDPSDESSNLHGTAVGDVAVRSGTNVTLTAIKTYQEADGTSNQIMADGFNYTATLGNVRVVNYSGASLTNTPLAALLANTNAGKIVVLQAGNFGGARPAGDAGKVALLGGLGIVAGGSNAGGTDIQPFSNRAGDLKDHYIMAPTNAIITSSNGTSMSTPRVSAAAATLLNKFGFLSPNQVVSILFDTAKDIGAPGPDEIYGHGVLDLNAAMSAAGSGSIPSDGDGGGGGSGGGVAVAALVIGGAAAYFTQDKEEELQKTILVDSYGRAFQFDLPGRVNVRDAGPNIFSLQQRHKTALDRVILNRTDNSFTQASYGQREVSSYAYTSADRKFEDFVSFLHRSETPISEYALGLNADLSGSFGALSLNAADSRLQPVQFVSNDLFSTPVLGYSSMGSSFMYGWNENKLNHRFGVSIVDEQEKNGLVSNSVLYESSVQKDKYRIGYQVGALVEDGSLYGGASDGAFSVDNTSTYYLGFNGSYNVTSRLRVLAGYFQGMSSVDDSRSSLLSDFSSLRSEGYAVGLVADRFFNDRDSFGVSFSSPLQTTSGSATLTVPVSQNSQTGAISFDSSGVDFDSANPEKVFEAYYNYKLSRSSSMFTHFSYTDNPVSNLGAGRDRTFFVGWRKNF